ncbi:conserved hypothetical protein [Vibrio crassostreae]|nr:conserved hypothetical protein [Vibrio crassostreae]
MGLVNIQNQMHPNNKQLKLILEHLFKREEQRQLVEAVLSNKVSSVYEAEKRFGISPNTGTRHIKKYESHIEYLKSIGLKL